MNKLKFRFQNLFLATIKLFKFPPLAGLSKVFPPNFTSNFFFLIFPYEIS